MKPDSADLIHRWREGPLPPDELPRLNDLLATREGRAALRGEWFLDAALPEALRTAPVIALAPQPSWLARFLAWFTPQEAAPLLALRWCAHASLAAAAVIGLSLAILLPRHQRHNADAEADSIAQIIFQRHFASATRP